MGGANTSSQESLEEKKEAVKKELSALKIEANENNVETVMEQQNTKQHPVGYDKLVENLNNPEELKQLMKDKNIQSIIHSEGITVWDHSKMAIQEIDSMDISEEEKADLKLIMLYHDLGKTIAGQNEKNIEATKKKLEKGHLHQSMIGHHKERLADIEAGFKANGVEGQKLKDFMIVVKNHMKTSLLEQDPKKTVKLFEEFGKNDEERKKVVKLLTLVLQVDGNATEHIDLVDDKLKYSKNEKKLDLDFDSVWDKYEEGVKILKKEAEKAQKKQAEATLEKEIFGKKISDYLVKDRGLKPGPEFGKTMGKIKGIMAKNKKLSPEELKNLIDQVEL